jgi:hypothetical protein
VLKIKEEFRLAHPWFLRKSLSPTKTRKREGPAHGVRAGGIRGLTKIARGKT